jgi:glyoxylase-like metal-dependent hydrolase (beta-lactamase superfamily II)
VMKIKGIRRKDVAYVMPTHVHLDHAGGSGELMRLLPNAQLVVHPRGAKHLIDPAKLTVGATEVYGEEQFNKRFGHLPPVVEDRVLVAEDGYELDFNGRPLLFLDPPGHAKHHYSVYDDTSRGFFTGDTFGLSYRELDSEAGAFIFPPTTPIHFDPPAWHESIERYLSFKPQRMFLTHYGMVTEVTRLADELRYSIDRLASIARAAIDANNRHLAILNGMTDYLVVKAKQMNPRLDAERIKEIFALDLEINTQGLEVWLDRHKEA